MKTAETSRPARLQLVRSPASGSEAKQLFAEPNTPGLLEQRRPLENCRPSSPTLRVVSSPPAAEPVVPVEAPFKISWSPLAGELERLILNLLNAPAPPGQSAHAAFHEKEHRVGAVFASLCVSDAMALHRRLTIPAPDDLLAKAFARLTGERRDRLVRFLGDARRRAAIAKNRP